MLKTLNPKPKTSSLERCTNKLKKPWKDPKSLHTWRFMGSYKGSFKGPFKGIYRDSIRV